ncbi:hypothetical protein P5673_005384 [Acropora cervicornis]|uniref:Uncharacterized protein n=1 Tax=Acropora cervicornis TaxID=6130 RepID=A0AAD9QY44_ACRCE|nr:hypothetical protein P5673_005384 [Acropora cervicornis]
MMNEMRPKGWEDIAFRLSALCGGFEKYDIVEDMGLSARNRRKPSLASDSRQNLDAMLRRKSTESTTSTDSQEDDVLLSSSSETDLHKTNSLSSEEFKRTLNKNTSKDNTLPKTISMDLDMSSFDFTELQSDRLSSTEI